MQIGRYTNFFVNRNEFAVVPVCLRHLQGLAVWCRRHKFSPMINKLSVNRFREIKKIVVIFTLKEPCVAKKEGRFHRALESKHSRFTQVSYIEDITRWREEMNFMVEWQELYRTQMCSIYGSPYLIIVQ